MKTKRRFRERAITMLLVFVMLFSMIPPCIVIVAEDEIDEAKSVIGSIVRLKPAVIVFMYGNVTESGASQNARVYPSDLPETFIVLDAIRTTYNVTFYKLGTIDGSAHDVLDVSPWVNAAAVEIVSTPEPEPDDGLVRGEVGLLVDGKETTTLTIARDEKTYVFTELSEVFTGTPIYRWELLIDREQNKWGTVQDYVFPYATVSRALIANAGVEGTNVVLRCIVSQNGIDYVSNELTIILEPSVDSSADGEIAMFAAPKNATSSLGVAGEETVFASSDDNVTRDGGAFQVVIQYVYWNNSPLPEAGHGTTAMPTYTATVSENYPLTATVTAIDIAGFKPYIRVDSNQTGARRYAAKEDPDDPDSAVEEHFYRESPSISFSHQTTEKRVTVYYLPEEVSFTVNHHIQNLEDDEYTLYQTDDLTGFSLSPVGEGKQMTMDGFSNLFYDPNTPISPNGNTIIDIYYDREYYLIDFELSDGYGVMPLYVRYQTIVQVGTPQRPGYTFDGWTLNRVYNKVETTVDGEVQVTETDVTDQTIKNQYTNPTNGFTVKHNLKYTANWQVATASYTIIYWRENANDNGFSIWTIETATANSGSKVDVSGKRVPNNTESSYFTYNGALSDKSVTVKGDGTAAANIYYTRNIYYIVFTGTSAQGATSCRIAEHTHNKTNCCSVEGCDHTSGTCQIEMYCTKEEHTHTDECNYKQICTQVEHIAHTNACVIGCGKTEHPTHTNNCYSAGNRSTPYYGAPSNPKEGQVYHFQYGYWSEKYIYINGQWYEYDGSADDGDVLNPNCGGIHVHSDSCYTQCTIHAHNDACYTSDCNKVAHEHSDGCYQSCIRYAHTHNGCTGYLYVISAKYNSDIADRWPTETEVAVWREKGWLNSNVYYELWGSNFATKRVDMVSDLCATGSSANRTTTLQLDSINTAGKTTVKYMFESVDQTNGEGKVWYNNRYYEEDMRYHQEGIVSTSLSPKDVIGMTPTKTSSTNAQNNIITLYYNRDSYTLTFMNGDHAERTVSLKYETPLAAQYFIPNPPSSYEANSVYFAGWYTTQACADGTEFDFSSGIMPASNLYLYAKWEPTAFNFKVYQEKPTDNNPNPTVLLERENVLFGTLPNALGGEPTRKSPVEDYIFAGWYYEDENGSEKRFDFNTMPIKQDYEIYAKWTSKVPVRYIVYYKTKVNGELVDIAPPTEGKALAGITKSFMAKAGLELNEGYRTNYFPTEREHTHQMEHIEEGDGVNRIIFEYIKSSTVAYQVRHVFESESFVEITGSNTLTLVWQETMTTAHSAKLEENFQDEITEGNVEEKLKEMGYSDSKATEIWEIIVNLSPDAFNKSLVLLPPEGDNLNHAENEIVFHWSGLYEMTIYEVHHMCETGDNEYVLRGEPHVYNARYTETATAEMPDALTFKGYKYADRYKTNNADNQSLALKKATAGTGGLVIYLYYDRVEYSYSVRYREEDGTLIPHTPVVTGKAKYQSKLTVGDLVKDINILGYTLINGSDKVVLENDNQVIDCIYRKQTASYIYRPLNGSGRVDVFQELDVPFNVADKKPTGSLATPDAGWILEGWYVGDVSGENLQDISTVGATIDAYGRLVPRAPVSEDIGKTYYFWAKFVPTSLTIQNAIGEATVNPPPALDIGDQSFIYHIKGFDGTQTAGVDLRVAVLVGKPQVILGLPVGTYTVTVESEWSWRYDSEPGVSIESGSGEITDISGMEWTLEFGGSDVMTVVYGIPGPDVQRPAEGNPYYFITDNAYGE